MLKDLLRAYAHITIKIIILKKYYSQYTRLASSYLYIEISFYFILLNIFIKLAIKEMISLFYNTNIIENLKNRSKHIVSLR